jgi:hypothetical protein
VWDFSEQSTANETANVVDLPVSEDVWISRGDGDPDVTDGEGEQRDESADQY